MKTSSRSILLLLSEPGSHLSAHKVSHSGDGHHGIDTQRCGQGCPVGHEQILALPGFTGGAHGTLARGGGHAARAHLVRGENLADNMEKTSQSHMSSSDEELQQSEANTAQLVL